MCNKCNHSRLDRTPVSHWKLKVHAHLIVHVDYHIHTYEQVDLFTCTRMLPARNEGIETTLTITK